METNNKQPELSVVILCYKAGEFVREFVSRMINELEKNRIFNYELVLVGNYMLNSEDDTPSIVNDLAKNNPRIVAVTNPKEGMMGWDMRSGLNRATGRYISIIDGDGQVVEEDIVKVYNKIKLGDYDLVKTYRLKRGDGMFRIIISLVYNLLFKLFFPGMNSKDVNAKPKIITRKAFAKLKLESNDWFTDAEIMIQARRCKFKIGETPTVFLGLTGRRSFISLGAIIEFIKNLIIYRFKEFVNK